MSHTFDTFPNPHPQRDYLIAHIVHEFTRVSLWGHDFSVGNQTRA